MKKLSVFLMSFSLIIGFVTSTLAWKLPDTCQTKCYDNLSEITCPTPGKPFYGQDAQYTINPQSYTKLDANGNDLPDDAASWTMVRDNLTGLIWEIKTQDGSIHDRDNYYNWYDAQDVFIPALNSSSFGGFSDWRLPTVKELYSIMNNDDTFYPSVNNAYFPNTGARYWPSNSCAYDGNGSFYVYFDHCLMVDTNKSSTARVRAVRGGQPWPTEPYVDNGNGTVTDTFTGLMWQQTTAEPRNWYGALYYCERLILNGVETESCGP